MFLDTYFDVEDESIEDYEPTPEDPEQLPEDPLRVGEVADTPTLDPRLYFLEILQIRIRRVNQEWLDVAHMLEARIESAVNITISLTSMLLTSGRSGTGAPADRL
jgi:hypothetical protein